MADIGARKSEHLDVVLHGDVQARSVSTGFEAVRFAHVAAPELDLAAIDLSTTFLGRRLAAPFLISSMTGGPERAESINLAIADAAEALGIAMGVGSQRIALEGRGAGGFTQQLRDRAPSVPILANLGAGQLRGRDAADLARQAVDMIAADALIVHLNPLQEAVQPGGDRDWTGVLAAIGRLARETPVPIVVKEVGCGISGALARQLVEAGVAVIDVAGAGGTSWAAVEAERAANPRDRAIAAAFRDWGLPTATAVTEVRAVCPDVPLVASGGLRTGIDAAKAIRLGADMAGFAAGILHAALDGPEALVDRFDILITQLRITCFCTGSRDLASLRHARLIGSASGTTSGDPA